MSQDAEHRKDAEMSPARRDLTEWLDDYKAHHDNELLGSESIARLHEENEQQRLADIERLKWHEARSMLQFLSGYDKVGFDAAYEALSAPPVE